MRGEEGQKPREKVGELLRVQRLEKGIDLQKMATDLRISPAHLEALEAGDYAHLPGSAYVRAFLGSIARYLGLDSSRLLSAYAQETGSFLSPTGSPLGAEGVPGGSGRPGADLAPGAPSPIGASARSSSAAGMPGLGDHPQQATWRAFHKQVFMAIVLVLLLVLAIFIARLNQKETPPAAAVQPSDTLALPPSGDTAITSESLRPDSAGGADSTLADSASGPGGAPAGGNAPGAGGNGAAPGAGPASADSLRGGAGNGSAAGGGGAGSAAGSPGSAAGPTAALKDSVASLAASVGPGTRPGAAATAPATPAAHRAASADSARPIVIKSLVDTVWVRVLRAGKPEYNVLLKRHETARIIHHDTVTLIAGKRKALSIRAGGAPQIPVRKRVKIFQGRVLPA